LAWAHPVSPQAARWLLERGENAGGLLDLGGWVVLVPTAEAGRTLRWQMAQLCPSGIIAPKVCTPSAFVRWCSPCNTLPIASRLQVELAWLSALQRGERELWSPFVPEGSQTERLNYSLLASDFTSLCSRLAEAGLRCADVMRLLPESPDFERWCSLAKWEEIYLNLLDESGLLDPNTVRLEACANPMLPQGVRQVALVACPDPFPLAVRVLERLREQRIPVHVLIHGEQSLDSTFDAWGRPLPEAWVQRQIAVPEAQQRIHLHYSIEEMAEAVANLCNAHQSLGAVAVAGCDPETVPVLVDGLTSHGVPVFDAGGFSARETMLWCCLEWLGELLQHGSFSSLEQALALFPSGVVQEVLDQAGLSGLTRADVQKEVRQFRRVYLPSKIEDARHALELVEEADGSSIKIAACRAWIRYGIGLRDQLRGEGALHALEVWINGMYDRCLPLTQEEQERELSVLESFADLIRDAEKALPWFSESRQVLVALVRAMGQVRISGGGNPGSVEVVGWLEIGWNPTPHLVVVDMHDAVVPQAPEPHPLLPGDVVRQLGLSTPEMRVARDAYLFECSIAQRQKEGRMDVVLSKSGVGGDPRKPSRFLCACSDDVIGGRVEKLFGKVSPRGRRVVSKGGLALDVPSPAVNSALARRLIRATAFGDFLDCPFLFYLRHAAQWSPPLDQTEPEMTPPEVGTLMHSLLFQFAADQLVRDSRDAAQIAEYLHKALEREMAMRFGDKIPLAPYIQRHDLGGRLERFANIQVHLRETGWAIIDAECELDFSLGDWKVRAKVDRIDRHENGHYRIIDYKTGKAKEPAIIHRKKCSQQDHKDPRADYARSGDSLEGWWFWRDLQLPLYAQAWMSRGHDLPEVGYIYLPPQHPDSGEKLWANFSEKDVTGALEVAQAVVARIEEGLFWPPDRRSKRGSDWADWFGGDPTVCFREPEEGVFRIPFIAQEGK